MFLPSRLTSATLGDVLGALHRAKITGTVELRELSGVVAGRRHAISLADGMVTAVDTPLASAPAMTLAVRLDALFSLSDASIRFSVARGGSPPSRLAPRDFLHGRPRARDRAHRATMPPPVVPPSRPAEARAARAVLGVDAYAPEDDIRRAFRRLAKDHHPDRFVSAPPEDLDRAKKRLAAITAAYHALTRAS